MSTDTTPAGPVERLTLAAETLERLDREATPGPWVAVLDTSSPAVAVPVDECTCRAKGRADWPHEPGCGHDLVCYPDSKSTRGDARLIASLRSLAGPVAAQLRRAAERTASGNGIPVGRGLWLEDALAVADAILGSPASGDTAKEEA